MQFKQSSQQLAIAILEQGAYLLKTAQPEAVFQIEAAPEGDGGGQVQERPNEETNDATLGAEVSPRDGGDTRGSDSLWHRRLGHVSLGLIEKAVRYSKIKGVGPIG